MIPNLRFDCPSLHTSSGVLQSNEMLFANREVYFIIARNKQYIQLTKIIGTFTLDHFLDSWIGEKERGKENVGQKRDQIVTCGM